MKVAEEEREEIQVPRNQDQDQEIIEGKENVIHLYQVEAGLLKEADHMTARTCNSFISLCKHLLTTSNAYHHKYICFVRVFQPRLPPETFWQVLAIRESCLVHTELIEPNSSSKIQMLYTTVNIVMFL